MAAKRTFTRGKKAITPKTPMAEKLAEEPVVKEVPTPESQPVEEPAQSDAPDVVETPEPAHDAAPVDAEAGEPNVVGMYDAAENTPEPANENQVETDNPVPSSDDGDSGTGGKLKLFLTFFVITVVVAGATFFAYQYGLNQGRGEVQKTEQEKASVPTPTPEVDDESVNRALYSIEILNGSGTAGEASKLQKTLTAAGYNVEKIGNARDTATETIIQLKEDVTAAYIKQLKDELSSTYTLGDDEVLAESNTNDVVITIGSTTEKE